MRLETRVLLSQEEIDTLQKAKGILDSVFTLSIRDSDLEIFSERAVANLGLVLSSCCVEK